MRIAIIHADKCKPLLCNHECGHVCPVNRKGEDCIIIEQKARIDEELCTGCGLCVKKCPFGAIDIVNLPSIEKKDILHRYGENSFALYNLPIPKENVVLGILGRNGIGKSTAIQILSGKLRMNLSKEASEEEIKEFIKGSELQRYFENLEGKTVAYKPQNLASLATEITVSELLQQIGEKEKIDELTKTLQIDHLLENKLSKLSGGELQKVAIVASTLKDADIYFFDEPLAYLDISERLRVSDFIKNLSQGKTVIVIEHDLLILDYLTEYTQVFYGQQGVYGLVSGVKSTSYGVNSYLSGFLKEENLRIRDKPLNFNFVKSSETAGQKVAEWPVFKKEFESFSIEASQGEVKKNSVVGILGRNGTGKTTFVKALAGLEEVEIEGKKQKLDLKLEVSYKSQYLFTESEETVQHIILAEKIDKKLISTFNLMSISSKKLKELSGGELQRFSIARCLSKDADIYLIDEPSAYLDVEERISSAKAIKEFMVEKEKTAFVVDHDLLLVSYLADSVIVFDGVSGKYGKTSEVLSFQEGISSLLSSLEITLRKDKESGRPKINKKGSVLDREQKSKGEWAVL